MKYLYFLAVSILWISCAEDPRGNFTTVYCGTYTKTEGHVNGTAKGIHLLQRDNRTGELTFVTTINGIINPSYLAISDDGQYLYAVSETGSDVDSTSYVYEYIVKEDTLIFQNKLPTYGQYACHVATSGPFVVVSNYSGSVAMYRRNTDGHIEDTIRVEQYSIHGEHPRQEGPHPHSFTFSPDGRHGYVADLGGDKIYQYRINSRDRNITRLDRWYRDMTESTGPRHMAFHPDSSRAYILGELSNKIIAADYIAESGSINRRASLSSVPLNKQGVTSAAIKLTHDGKLLFASNRGNHNSIAIYRLGEGSVMEFVDFQLLEGKTPRDFSISNDDKYLHVALQDSDEVLTFEIQSDGKLLQKFQLSLSTPVCLIEA